jgi:hypothetical protein
MTLDQEIKQLEDEFTVLTQKLQTKRAEKRKIISRQFIEANSITWDDVEKTDVPNHHFNHISSFSEWLATNSKKRFAEWNGRIYFRSDLVDGMMRDTGGFTDDLPLK